MAPQAYRWFGRLLNKDSGRPLARYLVHAFDLDTQPELDLGYEVTDSQGRFRFHVVDAQSPSRHQQRGKRYQRKLRLHVLDRRPKEIYQTEIRISRQERLVDIQVPVRESTEPDSPTLHRLARDLKLRLPQDLLLVLKNNGIHKLVDIRKAGGLGHLKDLPVPADHAAIRSLEAHANLSILSHDTKLNARLIAKGFTSISSIARSQRTAFVSTMHKDAGYFRAAQLHVQAKAQTRYLNNVLMGLKADWANGFPVQLPHITNPHLPQWFKRTCMCEDCESAVTPLAYLADLLDYTTHHLINQNQPIDIQFLVDTFHQPFNDLPASCESLNQQVRQVRLCVEVLQKHLGHDIDSARAEYCRVAYTDLLTRLGTSYEELRRISTATEERSKALAQRLSIAPDHLNALVLSPLPVAPDNSHICNEQNLERLFGLVDITRPDPLSTRGEPPDFQTWQIEQLRTLWFDQDWPADPYADNYEPPEDRLPIIDPDLIGPDDFREPVARTAGGNIKSFDIWLARRHWLDERLNELLNMTIGNTSAEPDLAAMLSHMTQSSTYTRADGNEIPLTIWPAGILPEHVEELLITATQENADAEAVSTAQTTIEQNLHLTVASMGYLMSIWNQDVAAKRGESQTVSAEEWKQVYSILVQAEKVACFDTWRGEEQNILLGAAEEQHILFGLQDFWISLREPTEGEWPPQPAAVGQPWIDPDEIKRADLPESMIGQSAIGLWDERHDLIENYKNDLKNFREHNGLDQLYLQELARDRNALTDLSEQLSSPDEATRGSAEITLTTELHLTFESIQRLIEIRAKNDASDAVRKPSAEEWAEVYTILTQAHKERVWWSAWYEEEQNDGFYSEYWRAQKARLPRWRATTEARQVWQQALRNRSALPIIDPDVLMDAGHLLHPFSGPAADLWHARVDWVHGREEELQNSRAGLGYALWLDNALEETIGIPPSELVAIEKASENGTDITARLEQLSLMPPAFRYLLRMRALANGPNPVILDEEWRNVDSILIQVKKQRLYAQWREDERTHGIVLGPDSFKMPEAPALEFPPPPAPKLPSWRATTKDLHSWEQQLQARIDQQQTVIEALRTAVSATEAATLPILRDALILATDVDGRSVDEKGMRLADQLLIDTRVSSCQMTTRVAQAIETLQGLLWSLRTGQLHDTFPDLELAADDFDQEWKWIGSYATWRAGMFVFMYPDNILLPSLRPWQTPAFRQLVSDLRSNRSLTPDQACEAASTYYDYFKDICTIELEASCWGSTHLHKGTGCQREEQSDQALIYLFGRPNGKKVVYWSSYNPSDDSGYAQTFWAPVPGLDKVDFIIGAQPYYSFGSQQRSLYLFTRTASSGQQKLMFSRYDLENQAWDSAPQELDLPEGTLDFQAAVFNRDQVVGSPWLRIKVNDIYYERQLNPEGTAWADGDWQPMNHVSDRWRQVPKPEGMVISSEAVVTAAVSSTTGIHLFLVGNDGWVSTTQSQNLHSWLLWDRVSEDQGFWPGSIVTVVTQADEQIDLFCVRGGEILWNQRTAGSGWEDHWQSIGVEIVEEQPAPIPGGQGTETSQPIALTDGTVITAKGSHVDDGFQIHLFVVGEDGGVYTNHRNSREEWPSDWTRVGDTAFPAQSQVTALRSSQDFFLLFIVGNAGSVVRSYCNANTGIGGWSGGPIGSETDSFPRRALVATIRFDNQIELFVVNGDGAIQNTSSKTPGDIDSWGVWSSMSDIELQFHPGAAVTTVIWNDQANLFAIGEGGKVYATWSDPAMNNGDWHAWLAIDNLNNPAFSAVQRVAAVKYANRIHLFVVGDDGQVYHNSLHGWSPSEGERIAAELPENYRYKPQAIGTFAIAAPTDSARLAILHDEIEDAFFANEDGPLSNLTYLEEAYYFVPVHLALQLQAGGQYVAALDWFRMVYDYSVPIRDRLISYVLTRDHYLNDEGAFNRPDDWLLDPLNPHAIAITRSGSYTRFTLLSLVRCFLDYADAEFTQDTAESVPRARILYMTALELLDLPELQQQPGYCDDLGERLDDAFRDVIGDRHWHSVLAGIRNDLLHLNERFDLIKVVDDVRDALAGEGMVPSPHLDERVEEARRHVDDALAKQSATQAIGAVAGEKTSALDTAYVALLSYNQVARNAATIGAITGSDFLHTVSFMSGLDSKVLANDKVGLSWLGKEKTNSIERNDLDFAVAPGLVNSPTGYDDTAFAGFAPSSLTRATLLARIARNNPWNALDMLRGIDDAFAFAPSSQFCVPPNPLLEALRLRAALNLYKLRTCRNIAGMERQVESYVAPTDTVSGLPSIGTGGQIVLPGITAIQPTAYRYSTLIERAKQLVQIASQVEATMLSAIEKRDAEAYSVLKARQDLRMSRAGITLQDLRVREAESSVNLAELQRERAQIQVDQYQAWLEEGTTTWEELSLGLLSISAYLHTGAAGAASWSLNPASGVAELATAASTTASLFQAYASFERREQEWRFQRDLAVQDVRIGEQQITVAEDHVRVVGQERLISNMQSEHAEATLDFLSNKFTNVELYDWMGNILERVYRYFLQQATATAHLAAGQLAFERQETPPTFIQADYWQAPAESVWTTNIDGINPDRRGLTGSARLTQDIYQLDQFAFETNKRKLQLTKTLSLARLAPVEFQRFRENGVMTFSTPLEMFDRDFPGHYLRLIHRVRTSVVALVPPIQGIHATLTTNGISRVVTKGDLFQTVVLRRSPESVALTSSRDATGLFELQPTTEMLMPFEALGVDTTWEFRMPKAANHFDYSTIADLLITIEYTALESWDYRQQVIQGLNARPKLSADRPFSFRHQFADQWWDLHNPDQTTTPMVVHFKTVHEDFPPNLEDLKIQQVLLYFARVTGQSFEVPVTYLHFTEQGSTGAVGGGSTTQDGLISSRRGNAGSWTAMIGKSPFGQWELALPDVREIREWIASEQVEDILFVITFSGRTPEWPG